MTPEEWEDCIRQGTVRCRSCGAIYTIKEVPPRYLWMPTRRGQITGPNGTSLVKFPTHRIIRT